jgi:uncharacterized LabA/DUF88 family protein
MVDTPLKIAVFIDFDNIEIGVKTTLNQPVDIGAVLEVVKERGEVVTKVAYGDWKRAGDYSRLLSQHAVRMVQRSLTPGGDKNGADINLALDALEMAFTHDHINAFVIVGGDSDFITLVEKLKQYDKKVFVVGGRQFTSLVMQRNCHEFIAYENLVGGRRAPVAVAGRRSTAAPSGPTEVSRAIPLVKRALKVLVDREVSPQLGLLKSTLLQLDSTFSERDYGASTFRDFMEKIASTGLIALRQSGRSLLVDVTDVSQSLETPAAAVPEPPREDAAAGGAPSEAEPEETRAPAAQDAGQTRELVERVRTVLQGAGRQLRWPLYVRQVRQFLRSADEAFTGPQLGSAGVLDFLRACQHEGVLRLERDRRGVLRVFPGAAGARPLGADGMPVGPEAGEIAEQPLESVPEAPQVSAEAEQAEWGAVEPAAGERGAPAEVAIEIEPEAEPGQAAAPEAEAPAAPARARRTRRTPASGKPGARKSTGAKAAPRKKRDRV